MTLIGSLVVFEWKMGMREKKKEKKKEEILVGGQERRNDGKRNLFSSEETPSGFREKEIAPG